RAKAGSSAARDATVLDPSGKLAQTSAGGSDDRSGDAGVLQPSGRHNRDGRPLYLSRDGSPRAATLTGNSLARGFAEEELNRSSSSTDERCTETKDHARDDKDRAHPLRAAIRVSRRNACRQ